MSARGTMPLLAVAAASVALHVLVSFQGVPTEAQALVRRMNDIDRALLENPVDAVLLRAKVDTLRQAGLLSHALTVCHMPIQPGRPSVCEPSLIASLESETSAQKSRELAARNGARLFAVIIGISNYQKGRMPPLAYADSDARLFAKYVQTARTGAASPENIFVLVNEAATAKRIREALETVLTKAGPRDTVSVFVSAHGVTEATTTQISPQDGFLMAYDSDPQEMQATAYRFSELRTLVRRRSPDIGQILLYADVCHAGRFHDATNLIHTALRQQLEIPGSRFEGVLAGSSPQPTHQTALGGGHGVFSYFLLQGLDGAADRNGDGITADELFQYVSAKVMDETRRKQRPLRFGGLPPQTRVASTGPWLYRNRWSRPPVLAFGFAQTPPAQPTGDANEDLFIQPGLPFDVASGPEDEGQQVILNYLQGNEVPQTKQDFDRGAEWFRLARELKSSARVEARESFCEGRSLTFARQYPAASVLLEKAISLEPDAAYAYNALGITQLEQAQYLAAIDSFAKAIQRAPFWAYPRHNLALTHAEQGEYLRAEREFRDAIKIDPARAHLHYSLGLLYQRLGRTKDARAEYQAALALRDDQPEAHTGMGSLWAAAGKIEKATLEYRRALDLNPDLLPARHDLALLVSRQDTAGAITLWQDNIRRDPNFAPSRLSLARALQNVPGGLDDSAQQYRELLKQRPNLVGARVELSEVLDRLGRSDDSRAEMETAAKAEPGNFSIRKELGDLYAKQGDKPAAEAQYRAALRLAPDRSSRRRINADLRRLEAAGPLH